MCAHTTSASKMARTQRRNKSYSVGKLLFSWIFIFNLYIYIFNRTWKIKYMLFNTATLSWTILIKSLNFKSKILFFFFVHSTLLKCIKMNKKYDLIPIERHYKRKKQNQWKNKYKIKSVQASAGVSPNFKF